MSKSDSSKKKHANAARDPEAPVHPQQHRRWLVEQATTLTAAALASGKVSQRDLPTLLREAYHALESLVADSPPAQQQNARKIDIASSITPDYLICLEDGKKFKALRRHLRTCYNLTPQQYREKWNLPKDYPMVAESYSRLRAKLARNQRLGRRDS